MRNSGEADCKLHSPRVRGLALAVLFSAGLALSGCARSARPGQRAPDFKVRTERGQIRTLVSYRGRVLVLNFWASWCPPCIAETQSLEQLHQALRGQPVSILAISQDQSRRAYRNFLRAEKVNFTTARDPGARIPRRYGTVKIPETYIIAPDGRVARKIVSAYDWSKPKMIRYLKGLAHSR